MFEWRWSARRHTGLTALGCTMQDAKLSAEVLTEVFEAVLKPMLKLFVDKVEKIREMTVQLLIDFVQVVVTINPSLPYLIPAIESRMGQNEIEEDSEEVRLLHVQLCNAIITKVRAVPSLRCPACLVDHVFSR
jgi:hypothetical protein